MEKNKVFNLVLKRAIPFLTEKQIKNFNKYEKARRLYLKYLKEIKDSENDFNFVNEEVNKLPEGELKRISDEILKPIKELTFKMEQKLK